MRVVELAIGITSGNRASDVSARILAKMSVSLSASWNASLTAHTAHDTSNTVLVSRRIWCARTFRRLKKSNLSRTFELIAFSRRTQETSLILCFFLSENIETNSHRRTYF